MDFWQSGRQATFTQWLTFEPLRMAIGNAQNGRCLATMLLRFFYYPSCTIAA